MRLSLITVLLLELVAYRTGTGVSGIAEAVREGEIARLLSRRARPPKQQSWRRREFDAQFSERHSAGAHNQHRTCHRPRHRFVPRVRSIPASLAADKLEQARLVERQLDSADHQKRTLVLAENGRTMWHVLTARLHGSDKSADSTPMTSVAPRAAAKSR